MASAAVSSPATTRPRCSRRRSGAPVPVYPAMSCRSRSVGDRGLWRSARSVAQGLRSVSRPPPVAVTPPGDPQSARPEAGPAAGARAEPARRGGQRGPLTLRTGAGAQGAEQVVVQPRDGLHRDALRAGEGALADVGAAAEALGVLLGDHVDHPVVAL